MLKKLFGCPALLYLSATTIDTRKPLQHTYIAFPPYTLSAHHFFIPPLRQVALCISSYILFHLATSQACMKKRRELYSSSSFSQISEKCLLLIQRGLDIYMCRGHRARWHRSHLANLIKPLIIWNGILKRRPRAGEPMERSSISCGAFARKKTRISLVCGWRSMFLCAAWLMRILSVFRKLIKCSTFLHVIHVLVIFGYLRLFLSFHVKQLHAIDQQPSVNEVMTTSIKI